MIVAIELQQPEEHLRDAPRADADQARPAGQLRLLQDVVPERRALIEADAELAQFAAKN